MVRSPPPESWSFSGANGSSTHQNETGRRLSSRYSDYGSADGTSRAASRRSGSINSLGSSQVNGIHRTASQIPVSSKRTPSQTIPAKRAAGEEFWRRSRSLQILKARRRSQDESVHGAATAASVGPSRSRSGSISERPSARNQAVQNGFDPDVDEVDVRHGDEQDNSDGDHTEVPNGRPVTGINATGNHYSPTTTLGRGGPAMRQGSVEILESEDGAFHGSFSNLRAGGAHDEDDNYDRYDLPDGDDDDHDFNGEDVELDGDDQEYEEMSEVRAVDLMDMRVSGSLYDLFFCDRS